MKPYKYYHYSLKDLALLFGLTYGTVKNYAAQGKFNPNDLGSIAEFYLIRKKGNKIKCLSPLENTISNTMGKHHT
jgi:hypothetical protein